MIFTYENQGRNTYLVYQVQPNDTVDSMSLGMLTNNKIAGLAPAIVQHLDNERFIKYNVSARVSVKQFFAGPVNKKRLIGVFCGIVDAMLSAEEFMIDPHSIMLDLDYIYADVSTCETVLICLPIVQELQMDIDLKMLFQQIVLSTQFDQTENCDYVAQIINYLNSSLVFSLAEFRDVLNRIGQSEEAVAQNTQEKKLGQQPSVEPKKQIIQPTQYLDQEGMQDRISAQRGQGTVSQPVQYALHQPMMQGQPSVMSQPFVPAQPSVSVMQQNQSVRGQQTVMPGNTNAGGVNRPVAQNSQANSGEKKISMFYLLQHYNKENAALYKAQKAAKKSGGQAQASPAKGTVEQPAVNDKKSKKKKKENGSSVGNMGFAIPGQNTGVDSFSTAQQPVMQQQMPQKMPQQVSQPNFAQAGMSPQMSNSGSAMSPNMMGNSVNMSGQMPQGQVAQTQIPQGQMSAQQGGYTVPAGPQGRPMNFGETTVLNGARQGETCVLNMAQTQVQNKPQLIRKKTGEIVEINKPIFRVGKEKSYVDYFISDNTAISRSHANFICREGEYFVIDTNSTNHTYVNGTMIQSNLETKISHGTLIRLANEEFEFRLY